MEAWQPPAEVSAAPEADGKLDLGEADFDLGGQYPDQASALPEAAEQPEASGGARNQGGRRYALPESAGCHVFCCGWSHRYLGGRDWPGMRTVRPSKHMH